MSGNDQPPVPPRPPEQPEDESPHAEADYVMQPPPPGGEPYPPKSPKNKGVIIGAAIAAAVIVIGAIVGAVLLMANSDGESDKDDKETSAEDFCDVIKKMDASSDTAEDPTVVSDALRDAGTPKGMSDDEQAGRELLIGIGDDAEDGAAATKAVGELSKDDSAKVQAFITYIGKTCAEPTESPSPTS